MAESSRRCVLPSRLYTRGEVSVCTQQPQGTCVHGHAQHSFPVSSKLRGKSHASFNPLSLSNNCISFLSSQHSWKEWPLLADPPAPPVPALPHWHLASAPSFSFSFFIFWLAFHLLRSPVTCWLLCIFQTFPDFLTSSCLYPAVLQPSLFCCADPIWPWFCSAWWNGVTCISPFSPLLPAPPGFSPPLLIWDLSAAVTSDPSSITWGWSSALPTLNTWGLPDLLLLPS